MATVEEEMIYSKYMLFMLFMEEKNMLAFCEVQASKTTLSPN